jgi:hypothetical protein
LAILQVWTNIRCDDNHAGGDNDGGDSDGGANDT